MVVMTPPGVFGKPDLYEIIKISDDLNNGWCPVGLVSTYQGEDASLALVGHPSSDGIMKKIPHGVDVLLHQPTLHPIFPIGLVKTQSDFIVTSVETDLGR